MIKTEKEYAEAKSRFDAEFKTIEDHKKKLKSKGFTKEQVQLAIDPLTTFALQLKEEVEEYEKLKRGNFDELVNFYGIGRLLVALRVFKGMKQHDLAIKLEVKDSQVSRDENNEYHGASVEKVQKVLDALGVKLKTTIDYDYQDAG